MAKKNGKTIPLNGKQEEQLNENQVSSQVRMNELQQRVFQSVTDYANELMEKGSNLTLPEVIGVMSDVTYKYNLRSLDIQNGVEYKQE